MSMVDEDQAGAIDTGESWEPDNTPSAPISGDNLDRGAIPENESDGLNTAARAAPANPNATPTSGLLADAQNTPPIQAIRGGVKRIVSYLMGEGAAHPQAMDQAGAQVDPQGQMSPDDRNLLAVQKAAETGGPQAAWKLVQANRVAYNAKQAFAKTALQGIQGKPADLNAAIDAANKASQHILDGSSVQFAPAQGGVVANVSVPGGQPQQIALSVDQFAQWLDPGKDGQWDRVMENTAPATLQRIAKGRGGAQGGAGGATRLDQMQPLPKARERSLPGTQPAGEEDVTPTSTKTNFGTTPSTLNLSGSDERTMPAEDKTNYGEELESRGARMFPGDRQARDQWMAAQEQRQEEMQNKIDVEREKGTFRVQSEETKGQHGDYRADKRADASIEVAKQRAITEAAKQAALSGRESDRLAVRRFSAMLGNPNAVLQTQADIQRIADQAGVRLGTGQPNAAQPSTAPPQQATPTRARLSDGKFYIKGPDGKAKLDPNQSP